MAYGFKLGQIEGLDSSVEKVNLTITGTSTASYVLNYGNEGGDEGWTDNVENPNFTLNYHLELEEYVLIAFNMDEPDVGDEYTINLSLPEAPTQSFSDAVHQVLEESGGGSGLPAVTSSDNGKMLKVEDGEWKVKQYPVETVETSIYSGTVTYSGSQVEISDFPSNVSIDNISEWNVTINNIKAIYYYAGHGIYEFTINDGSRLQIAVVSPNVYAAFDGYEFTDYSIVVNGDSYEIIDENFVGGVFKSGYPIKLSENVYYDDTVTLTSGGIVPLTIDGDYDLDNFADYTVEIDGNLATYITSPQAGFVYPSNSVTPIAIGVNNGAVFATTYGYGSGEEHTIKISYPQEKIDANFENAVKKIVEGTTVFEGDLENEVPVSFDNYESNSALMYDVYINGALCKRLKYSVLSGTPNYSTYDTTGELYVELTASTGEITLYANEGDTCHVKIVKKSRPESIMIFANKSGDAINVDASFADILTAAKEGYTFQLAIDGQISGAATYSEIGTLAASLDTSNYTAVFGSSVTWRGESITWTVNLTNMSISGTVGGSN